MARVVVITGGARGLGRATAAAFAAVGDTVAIGDVDALAAASTAEALSLAYAGELDVRDRAGFGAFLAAIRADFGPIDVLINNAGVAVPGNLLSIPPDLIDLQLAVNLHGVIHGMELALPEMVARRSGHIINVASLAGRVPSPQIAIYTATKFGVLGITEAVRAEVRPHGVNVSAVLPTFARTDMTSGLSLRGIPTTTPEKVAAAIVRAVDRGHGPVVVPRWLAALPLAASIAPRWVRDWLSSLAAARHPDLGRRPYDERVEQQLDRPW